MTVERSKEILRAGAASALEKMSSDRCLPKKEITDFSFLELYARIFMEQQELEEEIRKAGEDYSDTVVPIKVLKAIRSEAGDIISFASGMAAKADAELEVLVGKQYSLPGFKE
jgi:NTP pyrophosphatase (non-canonical NTP hydrolase)